MKNTLIGFFLLFTFHVVSAQNVLSIEDAKLLTLEYNFGIKIAKNNVQLAENQTDRKVNGYLPTVSASGGLNGVVGGSSQILSTGQENSVSNAFNWGADASVRSDYTLLDKRRDLSLAQLKENLKLSNLELTQTIEQNLLQVYVSYYQLALQMENVEVLTESIEISKERLRRAKSQLEFGQGSGLDVLNAEVDIKRDSVNLLNALLGVENEKRNLNFAIGRNASVDFDIVASTEIDHSLNLEELVANAKEDNIALQINRQSLSVAKMDLDIIEAETKPTISAGASYDFRFSDNAEGSFIDRSNSRGLSGNLTVAWTLYDGSRDIRKQNSALNLTNLKLQSELVEQQLERDIINAWASYQNALFILEVEESAVGTNLENFTRTEEQVKFGRLTSLEFRQAQLNLLNAQTSVNNARLNAKLAEIQLLALVGRLL